MKNLLLCLLFLSIGNAFSQGGLTVVSVGEAESTAEKIAFPASFTSGNVSKNQKAMVNEIVKLFISDFSFYKKSFETDDGKSEGSFSSPKYSYWTSRSVKYLVQTHAKPSGPDLRVTVSLFDISKKESIFEISKIIKKSVVRKKGHELADALYKKITGADSIFKSHIVFISDQSGPKRNRYKELYIMDFDGKNKRQLTYHKATVLSPAFSQDGKRVLYSLIKFRKGRKNVNLRMLDITTGKDRIISSRRGINSGAVFMPGEKEILLTLSYEGNAEIYSLNLKTKRLRKVTKHFSDDVDPSISVDGTMMTFLSGRPGKAMIYTMDPRGREKDVKRISYVGKFNATPRFSPDGSEIVFASWVDNRFDLFRISSQGTGLVRLTKDFGSNEDPTFSNEGQFIAFNSLRVISKKKALQHIYIMDRDGGIIKDITPKFGNCLSPRWSK